MNGFVQSRVLCIVARLWFVNQEREVCLFVFSCEGICTRDEKNAMNDEDISLSDHGYDI